MKDKLKEILEQGINDAVKLQAESTNRSLVMQGKGDAFREVLLVLEQLEKMEKEDEGGKSAASEEEAVKK